MMSPTTMSNGIPMNMIWKNNLTLGQRFTNNVSSAPLKTTTNDCGIAFSDFLRDDVNRANSKEFIERSIRNATYS
jgi:hypothetical protein